MTTIEFNALGDYLKNRRARLDPESFGIPATRRRTPGLRREEVAQRANVSATWYTWLEQGRGGTPSADVLDHLSTALALTPAEREHLFLLAQNRPPEVRYQPSTPSAPVPPHLQRMLDALTHIPAMIRSATWDVLAWNRAAALVLTDYSQLAFDQRNMLRLLFCSPHVRQRLANWEDSARFVVASFRAELARTGASAAAQSLIDELTHSSPEFRTLWTAHDVTNHGTGCKQFLHATAGAISLEYSSFTVDGRPDLGLLIYSPVTPDDARRINLLYE